MNPLAPTSAEHARECLRFYDAPTVEPLLAAWRTLSDAALAADGSNAHALHVAATTANDAAWAEMARLAACAAAPAQVAA